MSPGMHLHTGPLPRRSVPVASSPGQQPSAPRCALSMRAVLLRGQVSWASQLIRSSQLTLSGFLHRRKRQRQGQAPSTPKAASIAAPTTKGCAACGFAQGGSHSLHTQALKLCTQAARAGLQR